MLTVEEIDAEIAKREKLTQIDNLIKQKQGFASSSLEAQKSLLRPEQAATPTNEDFIPTSENLAAEQGLQGSFQGLLPKEKV